jgi:signal transduction histidine kinase
MPRAGRLTIQARVADESAAANSDCASAVRITVTDTGGGIASEHREKIFQPFFTTKSQGALGLGLAICQGIVHAHGGRLLVDSTPGQGAAFSLWLPMEKGFPASRRGRSCLE